MIESRLQASGRSTIPPEVREALGLGLGDTLCFEIEGDHVRLTKGISYADDMLSDDELAPVIDAALADIGETYSGEEVFAELRTRIAALSGRKDAA